MKVELRDISDVKPYPNNPRINDHAVNAVAKSIQEFGFRQPIVVDEQGVIAAEQSGRKAFLMEIDPLYCDVIVQRWEQFTGKKAKHDANGPETKRRSRKGAAA